jgi:hypothetical protein
MAPPGRSASRPRRSRARVLRSRARSRPESPTASRRVGIRPGRSARTGRRGQLQRPRLRVQLVHVRVQGQHRARLDQVLVEHLGVARQLEGGPSARGDQERPTNTTHGRARVDELDDIPRRLIQRIDLRARAPLRFGGDRDPTVALHAERQIEPAQRIPNFRGPETHLRFPLGPNLNLQDMLGLQCTGGDRAAQPLLRWQSVPPTGFKKPGGLLNRRRDRFPPVHENEASAESPASTLRRGRERGGGRVLDQRGQLPVPLATELSAT